MTTATVIADRLALGDDREQIAIDCEVSPSIVDAIGELVECRRERDRPPTERQHLIARIDALAVERDQYKAIAVAAAKWRLRNTSNLSHAVELATAVDVIGALRLLQDRDTARGAGLLGDTEGT